jgi:chitinase
MEMTLRNVIYYNDNANQIPLAGIANLPYTDVIIGFLIPGSNGAGPLVGGGGPHGGAFDDQLQNNIRILQNAGKRVLISVGGATFPSSAYQNYAQLFYLGGAEVVEQIINFVTYYNFDGVDIDYEDNAGFGDNRTYDGVAFLSELTSLLAQNLPSGHNIITHAPQTPYWDSNSEYAAGGIAPYWQIWQNVGNQIDWINNQFYNSSDYDSYAALKVEKYQAVAGLIGPQKLLLGAPLTANPPEGGYIEGYLPLDQMISDVIAPLTATYGTQFGGVMGWQFSFDIDGVWGNGIGNAFGEVLAGIPLERDRLAMTNNR